MSVFDRRPPAPARPPRQRVTCTKCQFYAYDSQTESAYEAVFGHLMTVHVNRRIAFVSPNPGRRWSDPGSPWVQRARSRTLPIGGALPPKN